VDPGRADEGAGAGLVAAHEIGEPIAVQIDEAGAGIEVSGVPGGEDVRGREVETGRQGEDGVGMGWMPVAGTSAAQNETENAPSMARATSGEPRIHAAEPTGKERSGSPPKEDADGKATPSRAVTAVPWSSTRGRAGFPVGRRA
jgi:hypothetical protein